MSWRGEAAGLWLQIAKFELSSALLMAVRFGASHATSLCLISEWGYTKDIACGVAVSIE